MAKLKRPPRRKRAPNATPKPYAAQFNPVTNKWEKMNLKEARAISGELGIAFHLGQQGFIFFEAPSSSLGNAGGHAWNKPGVDGLAFNPKTGEIILYDNKAWKKASVSEAPALQKHLEKNLKNLTEKLEEIVAKDPLSPGATHAKKVLSDLRKALAAAKTGKGWPKNVSLAIGNFGGQVRRVAEGLGMKLIDYREIKRIRRPLLNKELRQVVQRLEKQLDKWEPEAAEKLLQGASQRLQRRIGRAVADHASKFVEKRMPKIIAEFVLKESTRKAAKRTASLVPLVGWVFSFEDIGNGIEDAMRGHVARGLAGAGLAIGDMAMDVIHVGDAVSGVGGTALSLGLQAGTIAGQVAIEIDRFNDRMKEMGEEIQKLGNLPDEGRLRDYYKLEEDDIRELKKQFAEESDTEPGPINLPALPPEEPLELPDLIPDTVGEPFLEQTNLGQLPASPRSQTPQQKPPAPKPKLPGSDLIC